MVYLLIAWWFSMAMLNNQMVIPHNIPIWRRCDLTATMLNKFWSLWDPTFAPFPMIDQECCKIEFRPIRCQFPSPGASCQAWWAYRSCRMSCGIPAALLNGLVSLGRLGKCRFTLWCHQRWLAGKLWKVLGLMDLQLGKVIMTALL
jgi:hypothetical protein